MWGERLAADPSPEGWGSWAGTLIKEKRKTSEEEDFRRRRLQKKAVVMNLTGVLGQSNREHSWNHTREEPRMSPKGLWILCSA